MTKDAVSTSSVEVKRHLSAVAQTHKEELEEVAEAVKVNVNGVNGGHIVEFNADGCNESSQPVKKSGGTEAASANTSTSGLTPHTSVNTSLRKSMRDLWERESCMSQLSISLPDSPYSYSKTSSLTSQNSLVTPSWSKRNNELYNNVHWRNLMSMEPTTIEALRCFMMAISLDKYLEALEEEEINLVVLGHLSREELEGFGIESAGARMRIMKAFQVYRNERRAHTGH